jgi:hypothetical protein
MAKINRQQKRAADALAERIYDALQDEGVEVEVIPGTRWDGVPYGKIVAALSTRVLHLLEADGFRADDRGVCVIVLEAS